MIKAVIDTNVLVSGLWTHDSEAPTKRILLALLSNEFVFLQNDLILVIPPIGRARTAYWAGACRLLGDGL